MHHHLHSLHLWLYQWEPLPSYIIGFINALKKIIYQRYIKKGFKYIKVLQVAIYNANNILGILYTSYIASYKEVTFYRLCFLVYLVILKLKESKGLYTSIAIILLLF